MLFWGRTPRRAGDLDSACLSQWWPTTFDADGERFASAEHYSRWRKATLFGDDATATAVLAADSNSYRCAPSSTRVANVR